ncbi:MAG: hypothetical protein SGI77_05270 [Pirellulaceae bacterium]|nr:hypothetical protein [Pirellulaceae bacterium]
MLGKILLLLAVLIHSVLPSVTPERSRTSRLSRGASGEQFKKLVVSKELVENSKKSIAGRQRLAVCAAKDPDCQAISVMFNAALPYAQNFLLADATTVATFIKAEEIVANVTVSQVSQWAKQLSVDWLVVCRTRESGERIVELYQCRDQTCALKETNAVATSSIEAMQKTCEAVSKYLKADFGPHAAKLPWMPVHSKEALIEIAQGYQLILGSVGVEDESQRQAIAQEGLRLSESALTKDPACIQAILLQASCHDILGQADALKETLKKGFMVRKPENPDRLAMLEFEGDYARYVQNNREGAAAKYMEMLEIDPNHLRAHWSLIETALDEPVVAVDAETLKFVAEHAAAIVAAHPGSPIATILEK